MPSPLQNIHAAGIKSILLINKVDRLIRELQMTPQDMFLLFQRIIDYVNNDVGTTFDPTNGDVIFASGIFQSISKSSHSGIGGWGFTLRDIAQLYSTKFQIPLNNLIPKLWGQNFFNNSTKRWQTTSNGTLPSGFEQFVLNPIIKIFESCFHNNKNQLDIIFDKTGIVLTESEKKYDEKKLCRLVMNRWLPLDRVFCEVVVKVIPSPLEAGKVAVKELYRGKKRGK